MNMEKSKVVVNQIIENRNRPSSFKQIFIKFPEVQHFQRIIILGKWL